MNKRAVVPLVIGLVVGVVAIKMGMDLLSKARGNNRPTVGLKIAVAKARIDREHAIGKDQIQMIEVDEVLVPKGAFTDPEALLTRVAAQHIPIGMYISESMLRPPGAKAGITAAIPPGWRAVAVKVDEYAAVGHWLQPGSRVDLLVVLNVRRGAKTVSESRVVLRNVEVLAVGKTLDNTGKTGTVQGRSVTLLVRQADAKRVHLASTKGRIRFAMRGLGSEEDEEPDGLDEFAAAPKKKPADKPSFMETLLAGLAKRASAGQLALATPQPAPKPWTVELLGAGSKVKTIRFAGPNSTERISVSTGYRPRGEKGVPNVPLPVANAGNAATETPVGGTGAQCGGE